MQDSDPARRNLSVTSLAFIVYALAGGSFESNQVRLQVINVEFSDPLALAFIAWGMLFWFAFRYWQSRELSLFAIANNSAYGARTGITAAIIKYFIEKSESLSSHIKQIGRIDLQQHEVKNMVFRISPNHSSSSSTDPVFSPENKLQYTVLWLLVYSKAFVKKPAILDRIFPYVLFFMAITLNGYFSALINWLPSF